MKEVATTQELERLLGENLKTLRLQRNIDRVTLCKQAGISINALKHLETGCGANIKTLIRVVRVLGRQDWILAIAPISSVNPLHMVSNKGIRQRARPRRKTF